MRKIYKYQLKTDFRQKLELPVGAEILSVGVQDNKIMLWAIVDTEWKEWEYRHICIFATGFDEFDLTSYKFLDTLQNNGIVLHVFEELTAL